MTDESTNDFLIHTYSRAEAIADGELIDLTSDAREYGIAWPVAMTRTAWRQCVAMTPAAERAGNDEAGRLHDVLWMLANALRRAGGTTSVVFAMRCVTTSTRASLVQLRAVAAPGDDGKPVLTVMFPDES